MARKHPIVRSWLGMSRPELDELYQQSQAGDVPAGDTRGTAIISGTLLTKAIAAFARLFAWQGKVFDMFCSSGEGILINKISPWSLTFIVAKVYKGPSWMDGRETIIIDYSSTSFFAKKIRDEIREVEPGVYLGKVWWGKTRLIDFALTYNQ
jgi:hypothetical protein